MKKIIFLNIDGVLNSESYYKSKITKNFDPECVKRLNRIIKETNANIVISSSWKLSYMTFKDEGIKGTVIGMTPNFLFDTWREDKTRGAEIEQYLLKNPCDNYVILDDGELFKEYQKKHWIQTDYRIGLTDENVEDAIALLNDDRLIMVDGNDE